MNERPTLPPNEPRSPAPPRATPTSVSPPSDPLGLVRLEVRFEGGGCFFRELHESHVIVGRLPSVQVFLDHHTVSRRHAEIFRDPFGRFWIRDLGSTNGTFVNDELVREHVLEPGDRIDIGAFSLVFALERSPSSNGPAASLARSLAVEEGEPTALRSLGDVESPRIAAEHLFTLMDLGRRLLGINEPRDRLSALTELLVRGDFRGRMAVALRVRGDSTIVVAGPHAPPRANVAEPYISRRVLETVVSTRAPVLAGNVAGHATDFGRSVDLTMSREVMPLSVVACPLSRGEADVLYVSLPPECESAEWLSLVSLAAEVHQQAETAWIARRHAEAQAAIEHELDMARQIQRALVAKDPSFPALDVAIGFEPCKWVGGDYVGATRLADGRALFVVADVCGKGLQAALVTASLHTMVHATATSSNTASELVDRLNRHLCDWLPSHSFVTLVCVALDLDRGELECVNAGHPPAIIVPRVGSAFYLQSAKNPALGVGPATMIAERAELGRGDLLAMFTDGLTELRNASKEMLGLAALAERLEFVASAGNGALEPVARALTSALDDFRGERLPEDDRAFLLARRK